MRIAYGDLISGISGDMFVGALLDLGLPLARLKRELKKIPSLRCRIEVGKKDLHAIRAVRFRVVANKKGRERSWTEIRRLIQRSRLDPEIKARGLAIFSRLAEAEGKIHGVAADKVRFHEVGAVDSIVDIMAAAIGTHHLKIDSFSFSRIPLGRGLISSRHGPLPLPGPATLELLKGLPVEWTNLEGETVTPTGAAIMAALGSRFSDPPPMTVEKIGYGAGEREFPDRPNVLRLVLGRELPGRSQEEMLVIETNIDDMNPEFYDYLFERLFEAGARDVFLSPIQMKKNRPATLLRVIAEPALREKIGEVIFRESSTIGLRYYPVQRMVLQRQALKVKTRHGTIRMKLVEGPGGAKRASPEYDDLKRLAKNKKIPLRVLYDEAVRSFKPRGR